MPDSELEALTIADWLSTVVTLIRRHYNKYIAAREIVAFDQRKVVKYFFLTLIGSGRFPENWGHINGKVGASPDI